LVHRRRIENSVKNPARSSGAAPHADIGARLMLVALGLIWGITWPVMKIALNEIPPLTMRGIAAILGAVTYYLLCVLMRRSLRVPSPKIWAHILVGSLLNIVAFSLFGAFAQIAAATSRVAVLAYTMPIWAILLAWVFLGERPNRIQTTALLLCVVGLAILIYPLTTNGIPLGIVFALAVGVCWAGGTVYLKWAHIEADQMGIGSWQMTIAAVILVASMLIFGGGPHLAGAHLAGILGTAWTGIAGNGIAYALWFTIIRRLPAATASLGVLASPVIGVIGSFLLLGEVPTLTDMIGFALIFVASACVLLTRRSSIETASHAA
jgi:drug/metabolite transporter (DMT)-like permease